MDRLIPDPGTTQGVYERQADAFDANRCRTLFEASWLERFAHAVPPPADVLDLGCGAGEPIARWLIEAGYRVTGMDFAQAMLAKARKRWPQGNWHAGDMRALDLPERFDGVIAWNSFFHLTEAEQPDCIARMARHLRPGGVLLLTVGPRAGEVGGQVGSERVFHASLAPAHYAACLEENDLRLTGFLAEDAQTNGHTVLMAQKNKRET